MKNFIVFISLVISLLLSGCASIDENNESYLLPRPVVLFWTDYPELLENINYITPHVWTFKSKTEQDTNPFLEQRYLTGRGILSLDWRGGRTYASKMSVREFSDYWGSAVEEGFLGIAIDEFGGRDIDYITKMNEALLETKRKYPDLFIAVWHAGLLNKNWATLYRDSVDLIVLESYSAWRSFLCLRFGYNILIARKWKIIYKSVFALGINDNDEAVIAGKKNPWSNDVHVLETQMRWIRRHAPEMPGIAFFSPHTSLELLQLADSLAGKIFR